MLMAPEDEYTQVMSFDGQMNDYIAKPFSMVLFKKQITSRLFRISKTPLPKTIKRETIIVSIYFLYKLTIIFHYPRQFIRQLSNFRHIRVFLIPETVDF